MAATVLSPAEMNAAFAAAHNGGRVEDLLALYAPDAVLLVRDGTERRGHVAIRAELAALLTLGRRIAAANRFAHVAGDIALIGAEWRLDATGSDGRTPAVAARSAEVLRRDASGRWLYLLDHPFAA